MGVKRKEALCFIAILGALSFLLPPDLNPGLSL
jgi:hypothetical protein